MEIFAGAMTGIRNPKAHGVVMIGPERAIHFILLAHGHSGHSTKKYRYAT
jgi:hypothetical protein